MLIAIGVIGLCTACGTRLAPTTTIAGPHQDFDHPGPAPDEPATGGQSSWRPLPTTTTTNACLTSGGASYPPRSVPPLPGRLLTAADIDDAPGNVVFNAPAPAAVGKPDDLYQAVAGGAVNEAEADFTDEARGLRGTEIIAEFTSPNAASAQLHAGRDRLLRCDAELAPPGTLQVLPNPAAGDEGYAVFGCGTSRAGAVYGTTAIVRSGRYLVLVDVVTLNDSDGRRTTCPPAAVPARLPRLLAAAVDRLR